MNCNDSWVKRKSRCPWHLLLIFIEFGMLLSWIICWNSGLLSVFAE